MPRFARIENGIVLEIIVADGLPPFTPEITAQFQEVPDEVDQHWLLQEDGSFQPPAIPQTKEPTLAETLETIFITAIQEHGDLILPSEEGDLFALKVSIAEMLKFNRLAAAKAKIEAATIPEALEPVRAAMLEVFPP